FGSIGATAAVHGIPQTSEVPRAFGSLSLIQVDKLIQVQQPAAQLRQRRLLQECPGRRPFRSARPTAQRQAKSLPDLVTPALRYSVREGLGCLHHVGGVEQGKRLRRGGAVLAFRTALIAVRQIERFEERKPQVAAGEDVDAAPALVSRAGASGPASDAFQGF